jgi:transcriptional regulator with XRE-family HTH domain
VLHGDKGGGGKEMAVDFKALLKAYRIRAGYGLRQFAEMIGEAPSNYAGVESGDRNPWRAEEKLRKVADGLGLTEGTSDWDVFFMAARGNRQLPPDMSDVLAQPMVPVLLRTVNELQLTDDDLRNLVASIRRKYRGKKP